jgi:TRAP-type C4-dicarboxylate transport system substrate-binding protein
VHVRLFAGGTLGRDPVQQFKLVRDRVADIAYVVMGYTPGDFPDSTIFELPFAVESSLEGSLAHWRLVESGVLRGYDKAKFLGAFTIPPQSLHTNFKLARIEDLKGQKIRSAGPYQSAAIELLGGTAVSGIPVSGAAEALSRGVVQGVLSDWNGMVAFRIGDAAKFHFEVPMGTAAAGVFMNTDAYNALPAQAKAVIDRHSGAALSRLHGVEFDKRYRENLEKTRPMKEHSFVFPSAAEREAIRKRLQPITERWIQENAEGRKRYDALVSAVEDIRKGR